MKRSKHQVKERVSQYRARMQKKGFRQVNLWVPDTRSSAFVSECRRQSLLAMRSEGKSSSSRLLDAVAHDVEDWTA